MYQSNHDLLLGGDHGFGNKIIILGGTESTGWIETRVVVSSRIHVWGMRRIIVAIMNFFAKNVHFDAFFHLWPQI